MMARGSAPEEERMTLRNSSRSRRLGGRGSLRSLSTTPATVSRARSMDDPARISVSVPPFRVYCLWQVLAHPDGDFFEAEQKVCTMAPSGRR